jgi:hypothetical protein
MAPKKAPPVKIETTAPLHYGQQYIIFGMFFQYRQFIWVISKVADKVLRGNGFGNHAEVISEEE